MDFTFSKLVLGEPSTANRTPAKQVEHTEYTVIFYHGHIYTVCNRMESCDGKTEKADQKAFWGAPPHRLKIYLSGDFHFYAEKGSLKTHTQVKQTMIPKTPTKIHKYIDKGTKRLNGGYEFYIPARPLPLPPRLLYGWWLGKSTQLGPPTRTPGAFFEYPTPDLLPDQWATGTPATWHVQKKLNPGLIWEETVISKFTEEIGEWRELLRKSPRMGRFDAINHQLLLR